MADVHILAIDLAKRSFQVCATDPGGAVLFNRTVSRAKLEQILSTGRACCCNPPGGLRGGGDHRDRGDCCKGLKEYFTS